MSHVTLHGSGGPSRAKQLLVLTPFRTQTTGNLERGAAVTCCSFLGVPASSQPMAQGEAALGAHTCFFLAIEMDPPGVLSVGLCSWSPGPGRNGPRPQDSLTAPGEIMHWTKWPQGRTPVTRHRLRWNAVQHSFDRVPWRWPSACVIFTPSARSLSCCPCGKSSIKMQRSHFPALSSS